MSVGLPSAGADWPCQAVAVVVADAGATDLPTEMGRSRCLHGAHQFQAGHCRCEHLYQVGKIRHQVHLPLIRLISAWLRAGKVVVGPCFPHLTSSSPLEAQSKAELWLLLLFSSMARRLRKAAKEQSDSNSIEVAIVTALIMVVDLLLLVTSSNGIAMAATVTAIEAVGFVTKVITTMFTAVANLSMDQDVAVPVLSCGVTL